MVELRAYRTEDLQAVLALFTASVQGLAKEVYSKAQRAAWVAVDPARWRDRLQLREVLLAVEGPALLGFIAWSEDGMIDLLYTAPEVARRGVASALYAEAESRLRAAGCVRLVTDASDVAKPFFERQGFTVVRENQVTRGGEVLRNHSMEKHLTGSSR